MVDVLIGEKREGFIERLLRLIHEGKQEEAKGLILALKSSVAQLETLDKLTEYLDRKSLELKSNLTMSIVFSRVRARIYDRARARDHTPAPDRTLDRGIALDHDRVLADILARGLAHELNLVPARDFDIARD